MHGLGVSQKFSRQQQIMSWVCFPKLLPLYNLPGLFRFPGVSPFWLTLQKAGVLFTLLFCAVPMTLPHVQGQVVGAQRKEKACSWDHPSFNWRGSSPSSASSRLVGGGNGENVTSDWPMSWTWAVRGSAPPLLPSPEHTFCPPFLQREQFQGHSLERVSCCWDHLDSVRDWTQLRPLYNLLRFWRVGAEIYLSCGHSRWASYVSSLAYYMCHLPIWSRLPLPSVSPCPACMGTGFRFHAGNSWGWEPMCCHWHCQKMPFSHLEAEREDFCWSSPCPCQCPLLGFRLPWVPSRESQRGKVVDLQPVDSTMNSCFLPQSTCLILIAAPCILSRRHLGGRSRVEWGCLLHLAQNWKLLIDFCWIISPNQFGLRTGGPFLVTKGE